MPLMYILFAILVLLLFVYEAVALYRSKGETISQIVWNASAKRPLWPFLFGLLMGHFFWRW